MSLSKKKYCFNRRKSDSKGSTNINQEKLFKNSENEGIKEINKILNYNDESIDNLNCQANIKEKNNKDLISQIPVPTSKTKNIFGNDKKEEINVDNNPELLYLINKNETENIDFINTLLKLKGITTGSSNASKIINFENNILFSNNTKNNEITITNNKNISIKSIPSNCSTSTSKVNTINCNNHLSNYEEEIFDMNNNKDKANYTEIKTNLTKEVKNIPLKEMISALNNEIEKNNCFNNHKNKKTISSFECNTNNSTNNHLNKNGNEFVYSKEHYKNIKIPDTFSNNITKIFEEKNNTKIKKSHKGIIPINNKSFYKKSVSNKNFTYFIKQKSVEKNKEQANISSEKKILNKRSVKRIPNIKKNNYGLNNINNMININSKNNSKERKSNSKNRHNDNKSNKEDNLNKINSKNKIDSKMSRNNTNKKIKINENENEINNISLIKIQKNIDKNYISSIYKNNSHKSEKRLIFEPKENADASVKKEELKNMSEKVMEIDLNELRNNYQKNNKFKQIKKNQINNLINRNNPNNEYLKYNIPFNSERKIAKIFQLGDKICDRTEISPNRMYNISHINSKIESNDGIFIKINADNMNSYVKLAKNKNLVSPSLKNKNKRFINNFNNSIDNGESLNNKNRIFKSNCSCNNINVGNNIIINDNINKSQKRKSEKIDILNNIKGNIIFYDKKNKSSSKFMNKIEEDENSLIKNNNFNINNIEKEGINDNNLKEITISKKKEFYNNSKTYKKQNELKVAEIFLFDKEEEVNSNENNCN